MCIIGESESGHGGRFEPCEAYKRLQEENEFTGNRVGLLEAENAALRQENQLLRAENVNLSMAHGPGNHTDWMLTRASKYEQLHKDLEKMRQDRDALVQVSAEVCPECGWAMKFPDEPCRNCEVITLRKVREKADALAEAIDHSHDLCASMDFLRERLEELRESISEPWRLHIDAYSAAAREMANRNEAVNELYECAEYTARMDMIKAAAKAYQEARHAG